MGRSFTSEVAEVVADASGEEYIYDFTLDGRLVHFRKPRSGEAMMMVLISSKHTPLIQKLAGVVDLFATVIAPKDKDWIMGKIEASELGPKTLFGENGEDGILADMLEQWSSGRPFDQSAPSSTSPPPAGSGSTQDIPL